MKYEHLNDTAGETKAVFSVNHQNLLALVEASPLGILSTDLDGNILLWNRVLEEITGWCADEVLGLSIQILAGRELEEYEELQQRTLRREVFHSLPMSATRKDGRKITISYSTAPIENNEGNIVATMAIIYDISEKFRFESELKASFAKVNRILDETVQSLSSAVEKRDPYTAGHQQRVAQLACALAQELGGTAVHHLKGIWTGAILHDVGKLYVPSEILTRPGTLSRAEFELVKIHPEIGHDILKGIEFQSPVAQFVLQHHERLDGSGYPAGLKGEEIYLESRILGVADVVEAMSSHRPYRPGKGIEAALHEINERRGDIYDANVVDACLALFNKGYILLDGQR